MMESVGQEPGFGRRGRWGIADGDVFVRDVDRDEPPLTLRLEHVSRADLRLVGGKAFNLAILMRSRLPVPPGFCVTTAAFGRFLKSDPGLLDLLGSAGEQSESNLGDRIAMLSRVPMPAEVERAVVQAWREHGENRTYAVRSSATVEDAVGHSFAGQFLTCLNRCGRVALLDAIRQCWMSLFTARSLAYHARQRMPLDQTAMGVVVQEMVPAEASGILFTMDPVSSRSDRMVIESAPGLGDHIVSGRINPARVILSKPRLRVLHRHSAGSDVPGDRISLKLGKLALKAERLMGGPLDLEWAVVGSQIFVLQARPAAGAPKSRSWEDVQIWSNVNTGEVMPDVATPMTWSMIQRLLLPVIRSVFRLVGADAAKAPAAGLVAGRVYFNANTGLAAVRPFWGLMRRIPNFAQALGGGHAIEDYRRLLDMPDSDLPDLGFRWPKYLLSVPRILRDLIRHSPQRGDAWTARIRSHTAELVRMDPEAMSTPELADFFERLFESQFEGWDLLFLATQSAALPLFQKACCDWLDDPKLTLGYRLFAGLGGIPEVEAGLALWRLAMLANADAGTEATLRSDEPWRLLQARLAQTGHGRWFLEAWSTFMLEHGHHCRGELELFNARWADTPDYVLGIVRGYLDAIGQFDPLENQQCLAAERVHLTEQCRRRLRNPIKRRLFSAALRRAQKLAVNREVWKDQAVRVIVLLRRILLVLGRRLCEQGVLSRHDDIFFLEVAEVHPVATGKATLDLRDRIRQRRLEYESNRKLSPPPIVVGKYRPDVTIAPPAGPERATILEGIPVSPGMVSGHVRVILRANDHEQILPGEILVAPFTDPAWTLYFVIASGVIMEQGGILSHGSIVAREFGLPAVTNLDAATRLLHTGDLVHLDGNLGRVTILDRPTTAAPAVRQGLTRFPS